MKHLSSRQHSSEFSEEMAEPLISKADRLASAEYNNPHNMGVYNKSQNTDDRATVSAMGAISPSINEDKDLELARQLHEQMNGIAGLTESTNSGT